MADKLWGGRFEKEMDHLVFQFTSSLSIDQRLREADLKLSIAHVEMLGETGILERSEAETIKQGLSEIAKGFENGTLEVDPSSEDIHSDIEQKLRAKIGSLAGKLHTARSRNDQVATATRLYLMTELEKLKSEIKNLQHILCDRAEEHIETILPGMTHLQHAQPVSLAHHLLAYFWMLDRDHQRLADLEDRVSSLPLGCGALAGTNFPIDRSLVAKKLGFKKLCENSLDAVGDRDFVAESVMAMALIMTHLSRFAEELILWSTPEFAFVTLDDSVTTGSSIMPQKKNPDCAELIRGRTGRLIGNLSGLLVTMKGLPLSYNRDLQEDKQYLFDSLDVTMGSLAVMSLMVKSAVFHSSRMEASLAGDFSNATDVANYLVARGLSFRESHEVVGRLVLYCIDKGLKLESLSGQDLERFDARFAPLKESGHHFTHRAGFHSYRSEAGSAPEAVRAQLLQARAQLRT